MGDFMRFQHKIKMQKPLGDFELVVKDKNLKETNTFTEFGLNALCTRGEVINSTGGIFKHCKVGKGSADIDIFSQALEDEYVANSTLTNVQTTFSTVASVRWCKTVLTFEFPLGAIEGEVTEIMLSDNSGNMICGKKLESPIILDATEQLIIKYRIKLPYSEYVFPVNRTIKNIYMSIEGDETSQTYSLSLVKNKREFTEGDGTVTADFSPSKPYGNAYIKINNTWVDGVKNRGSCTRTYAGNIQTFNYRFAIVGASPAYAINNLSFGSYSSFGDDDYTLEFAPTFNKTLDWHFEGEVEIIFEWE